MPCGHGRTSSNTGKLVDRGGCLLSKRYLDQKPYKERQQPMPVLRNSEQRCIILTFVTLELDAWKILPPFSLLVQGSDLRNHLDSEAPVNRDGLESLSPPLAIVLHVDLPKEQKINSSEHPDSANSCSSSGAKVLGQSHNRSKRTKSVKNSSSTSLLSSIVSNKFSASDCDGSNVVSSDVWVNNILKLDKPVKRVSRKKGKKKKQYKKSMHKKVSHLPENQCEKGISGASVSGTSISSDTASTSELNSQNNMSEKVTSHSSPVQDNTMEQDENKVNNSDNINSLATPLRRTFYDNEIDEYVPVATFSQRSAVEEISCNQVGMDEGSNHLSIKSCSTEPPEIIRSTSDENTANAHPIQSGIHCDISCSISFVKDNAPMVDSFIDNWKINVSENCNNDVERRSSIKDNEGHNPSKGGIVLDTRNSDTLFCSITEDSCDKNSKMSTNCYSSNHYWSKDVDTDNSTERAQCTSQASSSNDFQPVINRKRGRLSKKLSESLNGIQRFGTANMHDRTGKDNNHSIRQRVQNNGTEECICEPKKISLVSPHDDISSKGSEVKERFGTFAGLKQNGTGNLCAYTYSELAAQTAQTDRIKASSNDVDSSELLPKTIDVRYNVPEKLKRKPSSFSKQGNLCPMKISHTDKTNKDRPSNIHVQQNGLEISPQVTHQQSTSIGLRSCSNDFRSAVVMSGPHHKTQINVEEDTPSGNIHSIICMPSHVAENPISPSVLTSNSFDQAQIEVCSDSGKDMHEDISPLTDGEDCRYIKSESESSHADHNKLDNAFIPVLQKCLPVERKDSVVFNISQAGNLTASVVNESVPNSSNTKNEEAELSSSNSHHSLQMNGEVPRLSPCFEDKGCPSPEEDEMTIYHPHAYGEYGGMVAVSNDCLTCEVKDRCLYGFDTDLYKIVQAVNDSYKLQTASEGVHLVTGSPVAEFERFLHSASPVLDQIYCTRSSKTCPPDQLVGDSLCRHQFPNIPLRCLWQWYEKPGSYGMEVKVEDYYNSKRACNGRFGFCAYFVPYLSAIQLFGWSRISVCSNNGYPSEEAIEACEVVKISKSSSYSAPFPIFSKPLSQPHKVADRCLKLSSSAKDEVCNQSVRSTHLGDGELLFEYFESDQPQQRRTLFEKIKELVRSDTSSDSKIFGDPLNLECLNLQDLHPASWYSVAWYPIYRIPDGNFRAAFLTYHSLGHFVRTSSNTDGGFVHMVSPVVGLQSYNAKGECWFQPRGLKSKVARTEEALPSDPSEILKERLRTLERTASEMARASVLKGNLRSVNRQPDYEFFVSRRR